MRVAWWKTGTGDEALGSAVFCNLAEAKITVPESALQATVAEHMNQ